MELMEEEDSISAINIAPLVDVCLVLLLVYMVTMPLSALYGITVKEHTLSRYGLTTPQDHVIVHLTSGGIFVEDAKRQEKKIAYEDSGVVIRGLIAKSAAKDFMLKVDRDVPHGQTVAMMDMAKQNGAVQISLFERGMQ